MPGSADEAEEKGKACLRHKRPLAAYTSAAQHRKCRMAIPLEGAMRLSFCTIPFAQ